MNGMMSKEQYLQDKGKFYSHRTLEQVERSMLRQMAAEKVRVSYPVAKPVTTPVPVKANEPDLSEITF
jgi:hypothetical protein